MNSVILSGRMVNDAELKLTQNKKFFTHFGIAVERDYKSDNGEYEVDFIECMAFNQVAKYISQYGYKGREIVVRGNLKTRKYETQKGEKRRLTEVKVLEVDLLGPSKQTYEKRKREQKK